MLIRSFGAAPSEIAVNMRSAFARAAGSAVSGCHLSAIFRQPACWDGSRRPSEDVGSRWETLGGVGRRWEPLEAAVTSLDWERGVCGAQEQRGKSCVLARQWSNGRRVLTFSSSGSRQPGSNLAVGETVILMTTPGYPY